MQIAFCCIVVCAFISYLNQKKDTYKDCQDLEFVLHMLENCYVLPFLWLIPEIAFLIHQSYYLNHMLHLSNCSCLCKNEMILNKGQWDSTLGLCNWDCSLVLVFLNWMPWCGCIEARSSHQFRLSECSKLEIVRTYKLKRLI